MSQIAELLPTTLAFLFFLALGFFARHQLDGSTAALGSLSDSELLLALPALGITADILKSKQLTITVHRTNSNKRLGENQDLCQLQVQVKNIASLQEHLLVTLSHHEARRLFRMSSQADEPMIIDNRLHRIPNCNEKISYGL